jgi:hypothetical protein
MLVKTNKKKPKRARPVLKQNYRLECILRDHVAAPSIRRSMRHMNDKPKFNNRKTHGEVFVQEFVIRKIIGTIKNKYGLIKPIYVLNGVKRVFHYTICALARKAANQKMIHGIA